jgi:hypothetical protein
VISGAITCHTEVTIWEIRLTEQIPGWLQGGKHEEHPVKVSKRGKFAPGPATQADTLEVHLRDSLQSPAVRIVGIEFSLSLCLYEVLSLVSSRCCCSSKEQRHAYRVAATC